MLIDMERKNPDAVGLVSVTTIDAFTWGYYGLSSYDGDVITAAEKAGFIERTGDWGAFIRLTNWGREAVS
jgi:hypothetical protein